LERPTEADQYLSTHGPGTKARLALYVLLYTGVRRSDAVRLGWAMVAGDWLSYQPRKTRHVRADLVHIPVLPELRAALGPAPEGERGTFLVTEFGKPYSPEGFGNRFKAWCRQAGLHHCTAHGLRKAGATFAAENGATENQLRAMYGWSSAKMPSLYTRQAQRKMLAEAGMGYIDLGRSTNPVQADESPEDAGEEVSNQNLGLDTPEELPCENSDVQMGMVPRDRIELPTRGFSIHCSTD